MGIENIKARMEAEESRVGRSIGSTQLIAVSKVQPLDRIQAVLEQGHRVFGENRVQEAAGKWPSLRERFSGVELHLIGPLQTNKARQALEIFDVIQSVDRPKLAKTLARLRDETGVCPPLYIQINTGEESQKAGIFPADADQFISDCKQMQLPVVGLMCIPPANEEASLHFALLAKIAKRNELTELSMGMSGDFERAIAQGATCVRVGSAIFGERVSQ